MSEGCKSRSLSTSASLYKALLWSSLSLWSSIIGGGAGDSREVPVKGRMKRAGENLAVVDARDGTKEVLLTREEENSPYRVAHLPGTSMQNVCSIWVCV